jgi:hypothetical protein
MISIRIALLWLGMVLPFALSAQNGPPAEGQTAPAKPQAGVLNWTGHDPIAESETALIRAATVDEKIEQRGNAAVRIFVNPVGRGSTATLLKISALESRKSEILKKYSTVRVAPGRYVVQARCIIFPFALKREIEIDAAANNEYLIECAGHTGHTTRLIVHRIEK